MTDFNPLRDRHDPLYCFDSASGMYCAVHEEEMHKEATTTEKGWEEEYEEKFGSLRFRGNPKEAIKEFIREIEKKAYEEGKRERRKR